MNIIATMTKEIAAIMTERRNLIFPITTTLTNGCYFNQPMREALSINRSPII
jgi:hypothetical protein